MSDDIKPLGGFEVDPIDCPWPASVWTMTEDQYVKAVPDPDTRTAISGFLCRKGWEIAHKECAERIAKLESLIGKLVKALEAWGPGPGDRFLVQEANELLNKSNSP